MKELDNNQKARIADYINGKNVELTDEELNMLAEDDDLANECLMISEVAAEYDQAETKKEVRTFKLNTLWLSIAACLLIGLLVTVFVENEPQSAENVMSVVEANVGHSGYIGIASKNGENSLLAELDPATGYYTAAPEEPFELEFSNSDIEEDDSVKVYVSESDVPVYTTKVVIVKDKKNKARKIKKAKFADGFASGLYDCKIYHNGKIVDQEGILIGKN